MIWNKCAALWLRLITRLINQESWQFLIYRVGPGQGQRIQQWLRGRVRRPAVGSELGHLVPEVGTALACGSPEPMNQIQAYEYDDLEKDQKLRFRNGGSSSFEQIIFIE